MGRKSIVENGVLVKASPDDSFDRKFWKGINKIGEDAFAYGYGDFSKKKIVIPQGVKLDIGAFRESNISKVVLPDDLEEIPSNAFYLSRIKTIVLPKNLKTIQDYAFFRNQFLTKIDIPEGVKSIGDYAFYNCISLSSIKLPKSLQELGGWVFYYCTNLERAIIEPQLKSIPECSFYNAALKSINLPDSVETIEEGAFQRCNLNSINLPKSLKRINLKAFANNSDLKEVNFPSSLQNIGDESFDECMSLKSIEVPKNVEIGVAAFNNCKALNSVILNDGVKLDGGSIFNNCENLEYVKLPNDLKNIPASSFKNCFSLKEIEFPKTLKSIENNAFECCPLVNLDFPESLETIKERAFDATNIQRIIVRGNTSLEENYYLYSFFKSRLSYVEPSDNSIEMTLSYDNDYLKDWIGQINSFDTYKNEIFMYVQKDKNKIVLSSKEDEKLMVDSPYIFQWSSMRAKYIKMCNVTVPLIYGNEDKNAETIALFSEVMDNATASNAFRNYIDFNEMYKAKKIDKIPKFFLETFPNSQLKNLYKNNNINRFYSLVNELNLNRVSKYDREVFMTNLFKIYYALGGFSDDVSARDMAYKYVLENVATVDKNNPKPNDIGEEINLRFSELEIKNKPYNKVFAEFFMKYYKDNKDFMEFFQDEDGVVYTQAEVEEYEERNFEENVDANSDIGDDEFENDFDDEKEFAKFDFLCMACNNFDEILKNYPNMTLKGNTINDLLTPEFVAKHCRAIKYEDIEKGNEELAKLVGRYGYSQDQFEEIQEIFNKAKEQKENYVIIVDKDDENKPIQYEFLAKDDPRGFIIGDITNCCQTIGDVADSCVKDGFLNNNAGFLVFQKNILDSNGKPTGEKGIIGQAYIWYDPETQAVCYDNIEIPRTVIKGIRNKRSSVNVEDFLLAIERSADSIIKTMNARGKNKVIQVTTGEGHNDLKRILEKKYKKISDNLPRNRNTSIYSDAKDAQFVLRTYDQVTNYYADSIQRNIEETQNCLQESIMQSLENERD